MVQDVIMREMGHERGKGSHAPGQWSVDKSAKGGPLEGTVDAVVGSFVTSR
jgi:hypothetical protein